MSKQAITAKLTTTLPLDKPMQAIQNPPNQSKGLPPPAQFEPRHHPRHYTHLKHATFTKEPRGRRS